MMNHRCRRFAKFSCFASSKFFINSVTLGRKNAWKKRSSGSVSRMTGRKPKSCLRRLMWKAKISWSASHATCLIDHRRGSGDTSVFLLFSFFSIWSILTFCPTHLVSLNPCCIQKGLSCSELSFRRSSDFLIFWWDHILFFPRPFGCILSAFRWIHSIVWCQNHRRRPFASHPKSSHFGGAQ